MTKTEKSQGIEQQIKSDLYFDFFPYSTPLSEKAVDSALPLQPKGRAEQALSFYHKEDRDRCLIAGLLTRYAWQRHFGFAPLNLGMEWKKRPCVDPAYSFDFNISHSKTLVAVASFRTQKRSERIGLDVQEKYSVTKELIPVILHKQENRFISGYCSDDIADNHSDFFADRDDIMTRIWTAKEALVKQNGLGLYQDPQSINLLPIFQTSSQPPLHITCTGTRNNSKKIQAIHTFQKNPDNNLTFLQFTDNNIALAYPGRLTHCRLTRHRLKDLIEEV